MSDWLEVTGGYADLMFLTPLIVDKENPCKYLAKIRECHWTVKMRISGREHEIGHDIGDSEIASRFADMAMLRFRNYRKSLDWNFSEAQAIADTANTEEKGGQLANYLLTRVENWLKNKNALKVVERLSPPPKDPSAARANRRKADSRIAALELRMATHEVKLADITTIRVKLAEAQDRIATLEQQLSELRIDRVEARIAALEATKPTFFVPPPVQVITLDPPSRTSGQPLPTIWKCDAITQL